MKKKSVIKQALNQGEKVNEEKDFRGGEAYYPKDFKRGLSSLGKVVTCVGGWDET